MTEALLACYLAISFANPTLLTWDEYPAAENIRLCISVDRGSHYGWHDEWVLLACIPSDQPDYELSPIVGEGLVRVRVVAVKAVRPEGCESVYCQTYLTSEEPHPSLCAGVRLQLIPLE